jgi:hypothetical protein
VRGYTSSATLGWSLPGFNLDRLREAWLRWRGGSQAAS